MTLYDYLSSVDDPRRKSGIRTGLKELLTMSILSYLCGYTGYRGIDRFCKQNTVLLTKELGLKHPTPSYNSLRNFFNKLDFNSFINAFNNWATDIYPESKTAWISGDGKSLSSSCTDTQSCFQKFEAILSLFCQESGLILRIQNYSNEKESEINVLQFILDDLKSTGAIIRLDALHTQKKR